MKRILVTGSNGLLGQKITSLILDKDKKDLELIATSKGPNRYPCSDGYRYEEMDISDRQQIEKVISTYSPDVVINTAAITNVDTCHIEKDLCRTINVEAVKHLAEVCEKNSIHLIHLSTDFVFDGEQGPYAEQDTPHPISFYGQSKLDAEHFLQQSSCKWTIIRTILVYGITPNMSRSNIVLWVKTSLEQGLAINVVNDQWRMPTLAEDLAGACLLAAEKEVEGILHISGKDMMTIYQIAERVAEFWNLDKFNLNPISSASLNQEAKRPRKTGFILDKAVAQLGYQPHSFEEGLNLLKEQLAAS